jgi:PAS domain S-box-containing protein
MGVFGVLYLISLVNTFNSGFIEKLLGAKLFFPLNLNYLAFIIIISLRLQKNTFNKYRLEKILRLQNKQWDALFQTIQLIILEVDTTGKIVYVNPFTVKQLGYESKEEILGMNWLEDFAPSAEIHDRKSTFSEIIRKGILSHIDKNKMLTRSGDEKIINWTCVLVLDGNSKPKGTLCIGMDTTDLENAFHKVQEMKNELEKENLFLREVMTENSEHEIIGKSEAIIYAIQKAGQVSQTNAAVLLEGETGVGKELFADLIHRGSLRSNKPLIKVNCSALPSELIESELFGHEKGSFTGALQSRKGRFELADGGTIFLDEIGELPLSLQPKLLRVLQSGEFERIGGQTIKVDVRVISATNRYLLQDVKAGRFREDLFYRLNVYPITIPSLRNRKEDIPLLVDHFIKKFSIEFNKNIQNISRADLNRLIEYSWPGNIRELINLIERSVITSNGETLKIDWDQHNHHILTDIPKNQFSIKELEREHIIKVLKECNGRINGPGGAADKLGLNPNTLRSRMKKLEINRPDAESA